MKLIVTPLTAADQDRAQGFLQSALWASFKASTGWKALRVRLTLEEMPCLEDAPYVCDFLLLERPLRAGFTFAYAPHGPESLPDGIERDAFLDELARALRAHVSPRCLFVRFDLPAPGREAEKGPLTHGLVRGVAVQPPDTVLLDLRPTEEEILSAMKPKWRYNIRLAEKKGVVVREEGRAALPQFYALYKETSLRDHIALHPESYYTRLFELEGAADTRLGLYVARHEGEALAAILTVFRREKAIYLYGASSDSKRSLMPAYALQWAAICDARAFGCIEYDFFGIPPDEDPAHPMAGLYRFKTGFGGQIVHRTGSIDRPYSPLAYKAFVALEHLRLFWFKRVKKRIMGR